jgi:hypothetical protein
MLRGSTPSLKHSHHHHHQQHDTNLHKTNLLTTSKFMIDIAHTKLALIFPLLQ